MNTRQLLFSFNGKIGRKPYATATLLNIVGTMIILSILLLSIGTSTSSGSGSNDGVMAICVLVGFLLIIISAWIALALNWKRSRDMDAGTMWFWFSVVGFFVFSPLWFASIIMFCVTKSIVTDQIPEIFGGVEDFAYMPPLDDAHPQPVHQQQPVYQPQPVHQQQPVHQPQPIHVNSPQNQQPVFSNANRPAFGRR